jgi:hypothetical protein
MEARLILEAGGGGGNLALADSLFEKFAKFPAVFEVSPNGLSCPLRN